MPTFQLVLTSDTINEGRIKINNAFSATTGLWSGSTGFQSLIHNNSTGNVANGTYAIAGNSGNIAGGVNSTVFGNNNSSTGLASFVGGGNNNSSSSLRSFIGGGNNNVASGINSSVIGGDYNVALGINSFAGGRGSVASNHQFVIGEWNDSGNTTNGAFIIGNGINSSNRRNVLEVLENNNNAVLINGLGNGISDIAFSVTNGVTSNSILNVRGNGNIGINTSPSHTLDVNGDIAHKDAYIDSSSTVTTTNNTPAELKTFVFNLTDTLVVLKVSVLAYNSNSNSVSGRYTKIYYVTAYKIYSGFGAGTFIIGQNTVHEEGNASVDSSAIVSSGNIQIQATGINAQTWDWVCDFEVREVFTFAAI